jgi:hypothetical protein
LELRHLQIYAVLSAVNGTVYDLRTGRQLERKKLLNPNPTKHGSNPLAFYDAMAADLEDPSFGQGNKAQLVLTRKLNLIGAARAARLAMEGRRFRLPLW